MHRYFGFSHSSTHACADGRNWSAATAFARITSAAIRTRRCEIIVRSHPCESAFDCAPTSDPLSTNILGPSGATAELFTIGRPTGANCRAFDSPGPRIHPRQLPCGIACDAARVGARRCRRACHRRTHRIQHEHKQAQLLKSCGIAGQKNSDLHIKPNASLCREQRRLAAAKHARAPRQPARSPRRKRSQMSFSAS
jgi:hypothetical protein